MKISVITQTTYKCISLQEIKSHLRIPYGNTLHDDFLLGVRNVAINHTENYLNRYLSPKTVKYYLDDFPPSDSIDLPYPPVRNIPSSGLVYSDSTGQSHKLSSTKWTQDIVSEPGRLVLRYNDDWPTDTLASNNPISIEYECGYGSTTIGPDSSSNVILPSAIKHGLLMMIGSWFEGREEYVQTAFEFKEMPLGTKNIMASYRIKGF